MNIYVGNLSRNLTEEELKDAFGAYGRVASVKIIIDNISRESKGFGFIDMPSQTEAMTAIQNLNGKELNGRNITVNEARPREDNRGGGRRDGSNRNQGGKGGGPRSGGGGRRF